jgi:hypothetical protein
MTEENIPSRCSLKGMFGTFMEDIASDKQMVTGEDQLGGSGGRVAQPGTADYYTSTAIGGTLGAIRGLLDVGEDIVNCVQKKSIDQSTKPAP